MVICLLWHERKTMNWYMLYYNNCCYNCSQDSICGYLHIYDAAAAPFLIEERASLIDGNEGDTGDDMMVDDTENLMLKLNFLPYKVQSLSHQWVSIEAVQFFILTTRGLGSLKVWFCVLTPSYTLHRPKIVYDFCLQLHTFLIWSGLAILFSKWFPGYKEYYMRWVSVWHTCSNGKKSYMNQSNLNSLPLYWCANWGSLQRGSKYSATTPGNCQW